MQCFLPCFWTLLFLSKLNCCKNIPVNNYSEHIDPAVFYSHSTLLVLSFIFDETCLFLYSLKYHIPRTLLKEDLVKAYHFSFFVFVTYHILLQPSQNYFSRTSTNTPSSAILHLSLPDKDYSKLLFLQFPATSLLFFLSALIS